MIACASLTVLPDCLFSHWIKRHSCKSRAQIPEGSSVCICPSTDSIDSTGMLSWLESSSTDMVQYPRSSILPIISSAIARFCFGKFQKLYLP